MSRYLILPDDFRPEHGFTYGGLEGLADCEPYTRHGGDRDVRWCQFSRLALGDAAVYPVKLEIPGRGLGQFKFEEIESWRYDRYVLEALREVDRAHDIWNASMPGSAMPPGIDRDWFDKAVA